MKIEDIIKRAEEETRTFEEEMKETRRKTKPAKRNYWGKGFENWIKIDRLGWPDVYPNREAVLCHWFYVVGNGMEWNKDGWLEHKSRGGSWSVGDAEAVIKFKAGEKPINTGSFPPYLYSPSKYAAAFEPNVPDNIRPDWLGGVFEALELAERLDPEYQHPQGWSYNKETMIWAREQKEALEKRFGRRR